MFAAPGEPCHTSAVVPWIPESTPMASGASSLAVSDWGVAGNCPAGGRTELLKKPPAAHAPTVFPSRSKSRSGDPLLDSDGFGSGTSRPQPTPAPAAARVDATIW